MKLPPALEKLSEIKHAKIVGIVLTLLLDLGLILFNLFLSSELSYYLLLIGTVAVTFAVPYIFGLRDGKRLAITGIVIFLIVGAINGPLVVNRIYSDARSEWGDPAITQSATDLETGDYLANGTYTPFQGEVGATTYTFSVWYYSDEPAPSGEVFMVYQKYLFYDAYIFDMTRAPGNDGDYTNGERYIYETSINDFDSGIFIHRFGLNLTSRDIYLPAIDQAYYGPMSGDEASQYPFFAGIGALSMFCNIGLLFLIVILLYWWLGSAKEKRKQWQAELRTEEPEDIPDEIEEDEEPADSDESPDDSDGEFTCTSCGAPVSSEHNFCPKCGEKFDGIEDEADESADSKESGEEAENDDK
jgi:hypothetical protein